MDSGEFDPRFDAAFQPGYDPVKHSPGPRRLFDRVQSAGGAAARVPSGAGPADAAGAGSAHRDQQPFAGVTGQASPRTEGDDERPGPLGQNPYVRALWFVSAGLVVGGFLFYYWVNSDQRGYSWEGNTPPFMVLLQQSAWVMVPAMVTVGLAGLVGLLFLYAGRWRPVGATVAEDRPALERPTARERGDGPAAPQGPEAWGGRL